MEEILASIRRIIADDQSLPGHVGPSSAPRLEAPRDVAAAGEASERQEHQEPQGFAVASPAELPPEHGIVSAPQFASPEGPGGVMDTPHPLSPHVPERPREAAPEVAGMGSVDAVDSMPPPEPDLDLHESALREMHEEPDLHEPAPARYAHRDFAHQEPPMHDAPGADPRVFSTATSQSLVAAFNTLAISRLTADTQELRGLAQEMLRPMLKDWLDEHLPGLVEGLIRDEIDRLVRPPR